MAESDWNKDDRATFGDEWFLRSNPKITMYIGDEQGIGKPHMDEWFVEITGKRKKWFKTERQAQAYGKQYRRNN